MDVETLQEADTAEGVVELIQRVYTTTTAGLSLTGVADSQPRFAQRVLDAGGLSVTDIRCDGRLAFDTLPAEGVVLPSVVRGGRVRFAGRFGQQHLVDGDVGLVPADGSYTCVHELSEMSAAVLDRREFLDFAAGTYDSDADSFRFYGAKPISKAASTLWLRAFDHVHSVLDASPVSELLVGSARRLLYAATLNTFPNTALEAAADPLARRHVDSHPNAVRRAVAFCEAHPDEDLQVADIARAARVSVRSLQLAFRTHLNTTPMRYLRLVRLDRAHQELRAASAGDGTTVTGVATRWGYARVSRFAAEYRATFGVHPRQTLRRESL